MALQPFLHQGMLTTLDTRDPGASLNQSALTIIMTGCIEPSDTFDPQSPVQYMFVDAPLQQLDGNEGGGPLSPLSNTLMASATFSSLVGSRWVIPRLAKKKIVQYVELAHSKGIAVRVTEPIDFPVWLRCAVPPPNSGLSFWLTSTNTLPGMRTGKYSSIVALTG